MRLGDDHHHWAGNPVLNHQGTTAAPRQIWPGDHNDEVAAAAIRALGDFGKEGGGPKTEA